MTEARAQLSDLVSQVAYGGEPVLLTRHGKPLVALVPAAAVSEESPVPDGPAGREVPVLLDISTLDRQGQYTSAAHYRHRDEQRR